MRQVFFALRTLARSKGYAFVTVAILAIAIGANTAIFGVLHAVLIRALPYPEPSRLVEIGKESARGVASVTYPEYERWRDHARGVSRLGAYVQFTGSSRVTVRSADGLEAFKAGFVSASFFETMGVAPQLGRVFTRTEEEAREPVAVISDKIWRQRFAASESIGNAAIDINGLAYRVVGVMPASFAWPSRDAVAWIPITQHREWSRRAGPVPLFHVVGRLAPGVTRIAAQDELRSMYSGDQGTAAAIPVRPPLAGNHERTLYLLASAVALVLLIACANIAALTLARGAKRAGEIAVRIALGAGRARVAAEMFAESLLLACAGAAGGVLLASWAMRAIVHFRPVNVERMEEANLNAGVLLFCCAAALLSAVLSGLAPAWKLSLRDPIEALRGLGRGGSGGSGGLGIRKAIVAAELALTLMLLAGSGVMLRSLVAAQNVDLGFDAKGLLSFRVLFADSATGERRTRYFRDLFDRVGEMPQVSAVGSVSDLFEVNTPNALGLRAVEGQAAEPRDTWTPLTWTTVGGQYFETLGVSLVRGRYFNESDGPGSQLVAIIDEAAARRYWPGEDPVGHRFKGQDARGVKDDWITVVGVVKNTRRQGVDREPTAHIYEWYRQASNVPRDVIVRTAAPIGNELRGIARSIDPAAVVSDTETVASEIDDQLSTRRFQTRLLSIFAAIAFMLAAVGVYGVVSYSAASRMREFGIRAALGEPRAALRGRVLREALETTLAGLVPGLCGVAVLAVLVRSLVFGVHPLDPVSIAGAAVALAAVTLAAAWAPARRASRVDPADALREQ